MSTHNLRRIAVVLTSAVLAGSVAGRLSAQPAVTVNGVATRKPYIERGGEVYVPASALRAGGAKVSKYGSSIRVSFDLAPPTVEQKATEGKVNEWLTDGLWRVNVRRLDLVHGAYEATVEIGSATRTITYPAITGLNGIALYDAVGARLGLAPDNDDAWSALTDYDLKPGTTVTETLRFAERPGFKADRLALVVAPDADKRAIMRSRGLRFKGSPSIRIHV